MKAKIPCFVMRLTAALRFGRDLPEATGTMLTVIALGVKAKIPCFVMRLTAALRFGRELSETTGTTLIGLADGHNLHLT